MNVNDDIEFTKDPVIFSKRRLTIGMFRIKHVEEIGNKNKVKIVKKLRETEMSDIYSNLEYI